MSILHSIVMLAVGAISSVNLPSGAEQQRFFGETAPSSAVWVPLPSQPESERRQKAQENQRPPAAYFDAPPVHSAQTLLR